MVRVRYDSFENANTHCFMLKECSSQDFFSNFRDINFNQNTSANIKHYLGEGQTIIIDATSIQKCFYQFLVKKVATVLERILR